MLKEAEWNTLNTILLDLYTVNDVKILASKTLSALRLLIPFSKGYFIFLDKKRQISKDLSVFLGFDESSVEKYIGTYHEKDYIQYLYSLTNESTVYKESAMIDECVQTETEFYQFFACQILLKNLPKAALAPGLKTSGGQVRNVKSALYPNCRMPSWTCSPRSLWEIPRQK